MTARLSLSKSKTRSFGVGNREGHDASAYYSRQLHLAYHTTSITQDFVNQLEQANTIHCADARDMHHLPDNSIALAFTSPPYNVGKDYDEDLDLPTYLSLIQAVAYEVYRTLIPGGRYVIN